MASTEEPITTSPDTMRAIKQTLIFIEAASHALEVGCATEAAIARGLEPIPVLFFTLGYLAEQMGLGPMDTPYPLKPGFELSFAKLSRLLDEYPFADFSHR